VPTGDEPTRPAGHPADLTATRVQTSGQLAADEAAAVLELVGRAAATDGVSPLSEHTMLHLRHGGDHAARNVLIWHDGELAGYGHLDPAEPADPDQRTAGELVIDPRLRGRGLGLVLVRALTAEAGDGKLRLWAHGDLPGASGLAAAAGLHRVRALWRMGRSLRTDAGEPVLPDGVTVRTFVAGQDEDAWLRLNSRAFATHPEQGSWTRADLEVREREPWFDPDGFFIAERAGRLAGFHWTKVHNGNEGDPATAVEKGGGHEAIGEVYVVGVDPDERGSGLGRALTLVGLRYLRGRGLPRVMLYVDETNVAAIRLYESLGFTRWDTDVMFSASDG
jgi:mycothiol synthase